MLRAKGRLAATRRRAMGSTRPLSPCEMPNLLENQGIWRVAVASPGAPPCPAAGTTPGITPGSSATTINAAASRRTKRCTRPIDRPDARVDAASPIPDLETETMIEPVEPDRAADRTRVVQGQCVDVRVVLGGRRSITQQNSCDAKK